MPATIGLAPPRGKEESMVGRSVFAVLAGTLLCAPPAWTQSPQGNVELESVLVSPRRIPGSTLDISRVPGSATIITKETIKKLRATTMQEVLSRAEGITFSDQQGFGLGSDSTVNIRGIVNSSRTNALVLVDGVRQNRLTGDDVHWQSIPAAQIERIEILRGGSALIYGEGALGGVINIVTKQAGDRLLETETGAEAGSFGWQQYRLAARGRRIPFSYSLDYTRSLVQGYRESSQSRNTMVGAHFGGEVLPSLRTALHVRHHEDTTGFPGLLTLAQSQQRQQQTNAFHGLNDNEDDQVSLDLIGGPWQGVSALMTLYWKRRVQTSEDSINFNSFTVTPSHGLNLRTNVEWTGLSMQNLFVQGIELSNDKATTGDPGIGADSESNRAAYGLYVEDTLTIRDRLSIVAGLRFDQSRYEESLTFPVFDGTLRFQGWSPKLGLIVNAVPEALDVFASYARPFKAPNVDDFSSRLGSSFSGNADLEPQQADTYEVGLRLTHTPVTFSATGFYTRIDDEILLNALATPFSTNQNFHTRRFGVELAGRWAWAERLRSSATYTFVDAEFRKGPFAGRTIPGTPEHLLNASIGVSPWPGLWMDLHWQLVQDYLRVNDMNNALGGADNYGVLDLICQYDLPESVTRLRLPDMSAYVKILNLTNEEYVTYQSSNGSSLSGAGEAPMPPTSVIAGVDFSF